MVARDAKLGRLAAEIARAQQRVREARELERSALDTLQNARTAYHLARVVRQDAYNAQQWRWRCYRKAFGSTNKKRRAARAEERAAVISLKAAGAELTQCQQAVRDAEAPYQAAQNRRLRLETTSRQAEAAYRARQKELGREAAIRDGVAVQDLCDIKVRVKDDGVHLFFGGQRKPDGPGHGHYVLDRVGRVTYRRPPRSHPSGPPLQ